MRGVKAIVDGKIIFLPLSFPILQPKMVAFVEDYWQPGFAGKLKIQCLRFTNGNQNGEKDLEFYGMTLASGDCGFPEVSVLWEEALDLTRKDDVRREMGTSTEIEKRFERIEERQGTVENQIKEMDKENKAQFSKFAKDHADLKKQMEQGHQKLESGQKTLEKKFESGQKKLEGGVADLSAKSDGQQGSLNELLNGMRFLMSGQHAVMGNPPQPPENDESIHDDLLEKRLCTNNRTYQVTKSNRLSKIGAPPGLGGNDEVVAMQTEGGGGSEGGVAH
jgi:hypothetical protein